MAIKRYQGHNKPTPGMQQFIKDLYRDMGQAIYEFINRSTNVPVLVAHGTPVERLELARAFIEALSR